MRFLVLILCSLLSACHHAGPLKGSGVPTDPPIGYTIGCINNPDAVACKEARK